MSTTPEHPRHFLARAHRAMTLAGQPWLPNSTTWRHYAPEVSLRTIQRAQQAGYLTHNTAGYPMLTLQGYQRY